MIISFNSCKKIHPYHWFLNGVKMTSKDENLVTEMDPLYPLDDKRGVARSQLNLRLTDEKLPR